MSNTYRKYLFVLLIPVINILASISTNYFPAMSFNPGTIRAFLILGFVIFMFMTGGIDFSQPNKINLIFLAYIFLLVMFSSDINFSFYIFLKVCIASFLFTIAFQYIRSIEMLYRLHISLFIVLGIILITVLISNMFSLGLSDYLDDSFYFGEAGVGLTKNIAIIILISSVFFDLKDDIKYKQLYIVLIILSLIVLIIGLKRSSLLGLFFGLGTYILLTPNKTKTIIYYFIIISLLLLFYPYYSSVLQDRFQARQEKAVMSVSDVEEEGRVNEIKFEVEKYLEAGITQKLFGKDIFLFRSFFSRDRMLHIDFINLLSGSGIIGLLLFLTFYFSIYFYFRKFYRYLKSFRLFRQFNALLISLFVMQFFMSIAGTIQGIEIRGTILFYMGAILGVVKNEAKQLYINYVS